MKCPSNVNSAEHEILQRQNINNFLKIISDSYIVFNITPSHSGEINRELQRGLSTLSAYSMMELQRQREPCNNLSRRMRALLFLL